MKYFIYAFMLVIPACNHRDEQPRTIVRGDTTIPVKGPAQDNSAYYTNLDTILVETKDGCDFRYAKDEFNRIVDEHPEFFPDFPYFPDLAYFSHGGHGGAEEFGSEVGQDSYYVLYAYFLRQKNGVEKYAEQRNRIIKIYRNINNLFQHFQYGGTYFGHQQCRILGYAEFAISILSRHEHNPEKTYDITKQKELYIKSLRQLIDDEVSIDNNTNGVKKKAERIKELNKIVDDLDWLIDNNFYLQRAQEFHHSNYEYY